MNYDGLLFFEQTGILPEDGYFIGRRRVRGIFQTGRRSDIKERINKGDRLILKRDYKNKFDVYAIAVYDFAQRHIGYIEQSGNLDIAFIMDHSLLCYATVAELDKTAVTVGVLVDIYCAADREELLDVKEKFKEFLILNEIENNK